MTEKLSKNIVLKALAAGKTFKFVESDKEVEAYYNQKIYAIKKDSAILKELVNEGKFPIVDGIYSLQKGNYHIIDIYQRDIEVKSQIKTQNIAYALYRKKDHGDFWNKIYRIRINPLTYYISKRLFSDDDNLYNLIGKTICVFSSEIDEKKGYLKVKWEGVEEIEIRIKEIEYENYLIDKMEEDAINEAMYEDYLIDQEIERIAEEESMYIDHLIDEEIEKAAMEEAAMIDDMCTSQEDICAEDYFCEDNFYEEEQF